MDKGRSPEETGIFIPQGLAHRGSDARFIVDLTIAVLDAHALGETAVIRGIMIEVQLVGDPEADQQRDGHARAQPGDIDERVDLIVAQVAPGDEEIVFEHGRRFYFWVVFQVVYSDLRLFVGFIIAAFSD